MGSQKANKWKKSPAKFKKTSQAEIEDVQMQLYTGFPKY